MARKGSSRRNRLSLRISASGPGGERLLSEVALAFRDAIARALRGEEVLPADTESMPERTGKTRASWRAHGGAGVRDGA